MAVQQRKKSKSKSRSRRAAADRLELPNLSKCPSCGEYKMPHRICPHCGTYKDRPVMDVKFKK